MLIGDSITEGHIDSAVYGRMKSPGRPLVSAPGVTITELKPKILEADLRYPGEMISTSYVHKRKTGSVYSYENNPFTGELTLHQVIVPQRYGTEDRSVGFGAQMRDLKVSQSFGYAMAAESNWLAVSAPGDLGNSVYSASSRPIQLFEYLDADPGDGRICAYNNYEYAWPRPEVVELTLEQVTGTFPFCPGGGPYVPALTPSGCGDGLKGEGVSPSTRGTGTVRWPALSLTLREGQITSWAPDADDPTTGLLNIYPLRKDGENLLPPLPCPLGPSPFCTVTAYGGAGVFPEQIGRGVVTEIRTLKALPDFPCWVSAGEAFDVGPELQPGEFSDRNAFGAALAMSEDARVLAVGAPYSPQMSDFGTGHVPTGAVHVYTRASLAEPFGLEATLASDDLQRGDFFRLAVAIEGDRIAVSGHAKTGLGPGRDPSPGGSYSASDVAQGYATGFVQVFERDGPGGEWLDRGRIDSGDPGFHDEFGQSLAWQDEELFMDALGMGDPVESGGLRSHPNESAVGLFAVSGISFAEILQQLRPQDSIRNAGCPGATTRDWIQPFVEGLLCHVTGAFSLKAKPYLPADLAIIMLGANDATGYRDRAVIEPGDFRENLKKLIARTLLETDRVVLLTPTIEPNANDETRRRLQSYRTEVFKLCASLDRVTCGPDIQKIIAGPKSGLPSVHPNEEGHRHIAQAIDQFLTATVTPPRAPGRFRSRGQMPR